MQKKKKTDLCESNNVELSNNNNIRRIDRLFALFMAPLGAGHTYTTIGEYDAYYTKHTKD